MIDTIKAFQQHVRGNGALQILYPYGKQPYIQSLTTGVSTPLSPSLIVTLLIDKKIVIKHTGNDCSSYEIIHV